MQVKSKKLKVDFPIPCSKFLLFNLFHLAFTLTFNHNLNLIYAKSNNVFYFLWDLTNILD